MDERVIDVEAVGVGQRPYARDLQRIEERPAEEPVVSTPFNIISPAQLEAARKAVQMVKEAKRIALSVTNEADWCMMGKSPYLMSRGIHKVACLFGVSFAGASIEQEDYILEGKRIIRFTARVTAHFGGKTIEEMGAADSDDDFFRYRSQWNEATKKKEKLELPLSERDLTSIRKKAVTNAQRRALVKCLGIDGVELADLKDAGLDPSKIGAVDYQQHKGKREDGKGAVASQAKITLRNMLTDIANGDPEVFAQALRDASGFKGQDGSLRYAKTIEEMSDGWAAKTLERIRPQWERDFGGEREPGGEG